MDGWLFGFPLRREAGEPGAYRVRSLPLTRHIQATYGSVVTRLTDTLYFLFEATKRECMDVCSDRHCKTREEKMISIKTILIFFGKIQK